MTPDIPIHPTGSYQIYTAHMHQSGTNAPILDYEYSQLKTPVTWTRTEAGIYRGTANGEFIDKTKILCFTGQGLGAGWTVTLYPDGDNTLYLLIAFITATDNWQNIYITLKKYY